MRRNLQKNGTVVSKAEEVRESAIAEMGWQLDGEDGCVVVEVVETDGYEFMIEWENMVYHLPLNDLNEFLSRSLRLHKLIKYYHYQSRVLSTMAKIRIELS